jgi:hypothetical protein
VNVILGQSLTTVGEVKKVLALRAADNFTQSLDLGGDRFGVGDPHIPELDSMAVIAVMGAVESYFDISVADDEISAEAFSTLGRLSGFIGTELRV